MRVRITAVMLALLTFAVSAAAQVFTPRVQNSRLPDYSEPSRFVKFGKWQGLPPRDRAVALWEYLTDERTGLYPIQGIYEDPDPGPAFPFFDERDLVKVLNVHGHGYCGLLSPTLDGIYSHAGFSDSRIHNMDANHHCVTEVYYDGGWHYLDMDLRGMLYRPDGTVASIREAMTERTLWTDPAKKPAKFYPLDPKEQMYESFAACRLTPMYHWYKNGHTMDFELRPGETLTRFWHPRGRWHHPWPNPGGFNLEFLTRKFEQEPRGLKSKHDGWSEWTHGNALFVYSPRLERGFLDFERGVFDSRNVRLTGRGVETASGGESGSVIFEVRTPWIIVGRVHELDRPGKIDDAATVAYRTLGPADVYVSTDNGNHWERAGGAEQPESGVIDFTRRVLGKYGYLVRFDLPPGSGLAEMTLTTWGQLAPVSLPRLLAGENRMSFSLGDRYGRASSVREIRLNLRDPVELEHYAVKMDADYQPLRHDRKLSGVVVLRVDAKPGTRIGWLTAGGYFHTFPGERAVETANAIHYSTAGPDGPWTPAATSDVPEWVSHWHYGMDGDILLDEPVETLYLRYVGDPGVNQIWVYAHCIGEGQNTDVPVEVTHSYTERGVEKLARFSFAGSGEYTVDCAEEPENLFLRFRMPSLPAR